MSSHVRLRPYIVAARERLAEGREKLGRQHQQGTAGIQLCAHQSDLFDTIILEVFESIVSDLGLQELTKELVLVPHGGYGRRDVAPFSDVDLMLLFKPQFEADVKPLAQRILTDLNDVGFDVGFSTRTEDDAWNMALRDPVIFSAQTEARFLAGSVQFFSTFMRRFRLRARRHCRKLMRDIMQARGDERRQYGETVYLLEPNVKRSRGGLRDIHLLRWIGFTRYGEVDVKTLSLLGALPTADYRAVRNAWEYLLRLRNELHFHARKSRDNLTRDEQQRIAMLWGYEGTEAVLPVENFMREYFEHTRAVRNVVNNFAASSELTAHVSSFLVSLFAQRRDGYFRIGPSEIEVPRRHLSRLEGNLCEVLRLMTLANHADKKIANATWQAIRQHMMANEVEVTPEAARSFLSLMARTPRLGDLLRQLHELRVLDKLLQGMAHARCLLQFNRYHKYTVDEHSIRAVEEATHFVTKAGPLGDAYRSINDRTILHLALLVHDLGKGFTEDHSEVGRQMALETARRLQLSPRDADTLEFLVHKHLVMSHLAFWRDPNDPDVVLKFASEVGSPERLKLLYVLTAADVMAVGPGTLNPWKEDVLAQLYHHTLYHLTGGASSRPYDQRLKAATDGVHAAAPKEDRDWYSRQVNYLPTTYILENTPAQIVKDLRRLRDLEPEHAVAWGRYQEQGKVVEYSVGLRQGTTPGVFHRLTGALTSQGLEIYSAEIHTLEEDLVLDRFVVADRDYEGCPPAQRFEDVCRALANAAQNTCNQPPTFRKLWKAERSAAVAELERLPTRIGIDTTSSPQYSIVDIFTHDRVGLLYSIARTLYECGASVSSARIGTHLDQVVDVFYVTNFAGEKITDEGHIQHLRERLYQAIDGEKSQ